MACRLQRAVGWCGEAVECGFCPIGVAKSMCWRMLLQGAGVKSPVGSAMPPWAPFPLPLWPDKGRVLRPKSGGACVDGQMTEQMHFWPTQAVPERLRWSVSRARRLDVCARRYYLHHYASVGGKRAAPGTLAREAYILKQLSNRYMWVGNIVHSLAEFALTTWRRGGDVDVEDLIEKGDRRMRAEFSTSAARQFLARPGEAFGLVEHAYNEPVPVEAWREIRARMERCVRHFYTLPIVKTARGLLPLDWLALETIGSFPLGGATIVVVPDVAWRSAKGQVILVDWKSGKVGEADAFQLAVYGLFAHRVWGPPEANVVAHDVYLDGGEVRSFELTPADLEAAEHRIVASVTRMQALTARQQGQAVDAERFAKTEDLTACSHCSFRRLCDRE